MNAFAPGLLASAARQEPDGRQPCDADALSRRLQGAATASELNLLAANEVRELTRARQVFLFRQGRQPRVEAVSGLATVNRSSPVITELERSVGQLWEAGELTNARRFKIGGGADYAGSALATYPFKAMLWLPFADIGRNVSGGLLLAQEDSWPENAATNFLPVARTVSQALGGMRGPAAPPLVKKARGLFGRKTPLALAVLAAGLLALPVPMAVNAPFQIVGANSIIVSAPLEGVVKEVLVGPGEAVDEGQPLLRFDDLAQRNRIALAREELSLSEARLKQAGQLSFESNEGRKELGLRMAEVAVKRAELNLAEEQVGRTVVRARHSGVVMLADKQSLVGRPVTTGERLMEIADPSHVEAAINLPVQDSIALHLGASVKLFLDSDPFSARDALIEYISYQAATMPSGTLAYRLRASLTGNDVKRPKLGVNGTAKIYGDTVPLAFYLFRRPISLARQWLGI